ncbi:hypothetical protein D5S17_31760 [Pseudonocardiaceae bacterium YIM PH 21723]|nr:hypothetical protein D5S17_31760 [Pseudonocardiaceae bacterium YIM PH 21723]
MLIRSALLAAAALSAAAPAAAADPLSTPHLPGIGSLTLIAQDNTLGLESDNDLCDLNTYVPVDITHSIG